MNRARGCLSVVNNCGGSSPTGVSEVKSKDLLIHLSLIKSIFLHLSLLSMHMVIQAFFSHPCNMASHAWSLSPLPLSTPYHVPYTDCFAPFCTAGDYPTVLVHLGYYNGWVLNHQDWVACKQQNFMSHGCGGWNVKD